MDPFSSMARMRVRKSSYCSRSFFSASSSLPPSPQSAVVELDLLVDELDLLAGELALLVQRGLPSM
jgi:hypothetical protein